MWSFPFNPANRLDQKIQRKKLGFLIIRGLQFFDVATGGVWDFLLLFCSPGFWDVGGLLRALSSPGGKFNFTQNHTFLIKSKSQSESFGDLHQASGPLLQRFTMSRHLHGFSKVRTFWKAKVIILKRLKEATGQTVYPKDEFSSQSLKSPFSLGLSNLVVTTKFASSTSQNLRKILELKASIIDASL